MQKRTLEESFRQIGLSEDEIWNSLEDLGYLNEDDRDFGDEYLSDFDDEDDEDLEEAGRRVRLHKSSQAAKRRARQYYKTHKMKIKKRKERRSRSAAGKRAEKLLSLMPKGGSRVRRVVSDVHVSGDGIYEDIISDLTALAESIERDPTEQFNEYVEAFNHIADLGEVLAAKALMEDDDEESADLVLGLSFWAEGVLKEMEELGGSLTNEEEASLSELLDYGIENVHAVLEAFDLVADDDFEDDDFEDDDFNDDLEEQRRPQKGDRGRKLLARGKTVRVKGKSDYGKSNSPQKTKTISRLRGDIKNDGAFAAYLSAVKKGIIAPGQKYNKGAVAAVRAASKKKKTA